MSEIENSRVLITGGARGLGLLTARAALEAGARQVELWDLDATGLETAVAELGPQRVRSRRVDVSDPAGIEEAARESLAAGPVDILFNNAGIVVGGNFAEQGASKWAVFGWSESLRLELERLPGDLRVTTVCPSYIDTGMFDGVTVPGGGDLLDPQYVVREIMQAVRKNKILLYLPRATRLVPFLRGIMPARWFDRLVGRWGGVYESMATFHGRP